MLELERACVLLVEFTEDALLGERTAGTLVDIFEIPCEGPFVTEVAGKL